MSYLRKIVSTCFNHLQDVCISIASRDISKKVACSDAERGRNALRWFTTEEAAVAEALATIIVPSDEETPGIEDVGVFGPPAIVALDNLVARSVDKQHVYSRGLVSFDAWALKEHKCGFAELPKENQITLFRAAQQVYEASMAKGSAVKKAWRKIRSIAQVRSGCYFAAQLYPQIRDDCIQVFYTSWVSWTWLDYDGPPMDQGYPKLTARR